MSPKIDPLIQTLERNVNAGSGLTIVAGYPGSSSDEKLCRIYLSLDLQAYVELDAADVLDATEPDAKNRPAGPPRLTYYLKADAKLRFHRVTSMRAADFTAALANPGSCSCESDAPTSVIRQKNNNPTKTREQTCNDRADLSDFACLDELAKHPEVSNPDKICTKLRARIFDACMGRGLIAPGFGAARPNSNATAAQPE
jgi:hypothetical protein